MSIAGGFVDNLINYFCSSGNFLWQPSAFGFLWPVGKCVCLGYRSKTCSFVSPVRLEIRRGWFCCFCVCSWAEAPPQYEVEQFV